MTTMRFGSSGVGLIVRLTSLMCSLETLREPWCHLPRKPLARRSPLSPAYPSTGIIDVIIEITDLQTLDFTTCLLSTNLRAMDC